MENIQFLSVMTPAISSGSVGITLTSINATPNLVITATITGINAQDSPQTIAVDIYSQLNVAIALASANFTTAPVYPNQQMIAQYLTANSEHIVSISSQCQFSLTASANTFGSIINIDESPCLCDVATFKKYTNMVLVDPNAGVDYTDDQLTDFISRTSSYLVSHLDNNVALTNYFHYDIGRGGPCAYVEKRPIVDFHSPTVRLAYPLRYPYGFPFPILKDVFHLGNRDLGEIEYGRYEDIVDIPQPFDEGNELIIPYLAGHYFIPKIIKEVVAKWATLFLVSNGDITQEAIDGVSQTIQPLPKVLAGYKPFLQRYNMRTVVI